MKKPLQRTKKIGSLAISETMILVLGVIVLVIIAVLYIFLGDSVKELISGVLKFPAIEP